MADDGDYDELEIELRSVESGFEARVLTSRFGRATATFVPPFDSARLQEVLESIERRVRAGTGGRRDLEAGKEGQRPDDWTPERLGRALFSSLFADEVGVRLRESLAGLDAQRDRAPRRGLRLRLTFDRQEDFAPLATLPWELLLNDRQFMALDRQTPIVRSYNRRFQPPAAPASSLRVLLAAANPGDQRRLGLARESERIRAALGGKEGIEVVDLVRPSARGLRQLLLSSPCHVLHFLGHGGLRQGSDQELVLWFEGDAGQPEAVTGDLLAELVKDVPCLRLVVLNACWGGALPRRRGQDPFTGVAAALMARDIPAVVAMQFPISDDAAIAFSEAFYPRLAAGDGVAAAVTEGRIEIRRRQEGTLEWATPVVFLAGSDRLFDFSPAAPLPALGGPSLRLPPRTTESGGPPRKRSQLDRRGWGRWVLAALLVLAALVLLRSGLAHKRGIRPEDAKSWVGRTASVCGWVAGAQHAPAARGEPSFLDFGKPFPDEVFRVVIFGTDRAKFPQPLETTYVRENVCARGVVELYHDTPEIIAHDPWQLTLDQP